MPTDRSMTPRPTRLTLILPLLMLAACAGGGGTREAAPEPRLVAPAAADVPVDPQPIAGTPHAGYVPPEDEATEAPPDPATDPQAGVGPAPAGPDAAPTQAELDYAAIYGPTPYDPVADPTLPAPAQLPASYDPWEGWNRRVHRFNNAVDRTIATPLARAYMKVVPRPVRLGVGNFFNNLGQPVSALNALREDGAIDVLEAACLAYEV